MSTPAQSYILCTTPRSGSTLLCGLLAATGVAGRPDSHFHVRSLAAWLKTYGLQRQAFGSERDAIRAVVGAAVTKGTGATDVFGLRLQRDSFDFFMAALDTLTPGCRSDVERLEAAFGRTKLFHLERDDKLAQAISLSIAEQSGLWHRNADGTERERSGPSGTPSYSRTAIEQHLIQVASQNAAWRDWVTAEAIAPEHFTYEALASAPRAVLADVLTALGQAPSEATAAPIPTARLADATNAAWSARFRAQTRDAPHIRKLFIAPKGA